MSRNNAMDLSLTAALFSFDLLTPDQVIEIAVDQLAAYPESARLRQVAGLPLGQTSTHELGEYFVAALKECGIKVPAVNEAAQAIARYYARQISDGSLSEYEGARRIWKDVCVKLKDATELDFFVAAASELEDMKDRYPGEPEVAQRFTESWKQQIRAAANQLLRQRP